MFTRCVEASRSRRRPARFLLGLLVSAGIFVGAGEFLTRQFDVIDRLNGIPRRLYLATDIPDLPYRLRPGIDVPIRDFRVRVNRLGLRGAEVPPRPEPGRSRILALGDSVVYGEGLDEADSFPVLLEQELHARGDGRAEVLNAAAPGYNTEAELAYLREVGLALGPNALVLGVSLNDYGPAPHMTPFGFLSNEPTNRSRTPWLNNHSEFYTLLRWLLTWARGGHLYQQVRKQVPADKAEWDKRWPQIDHAIAIMHKKYYAKPAGPGWESVRQSLPALRDLAAAHGLALTVVIFPEKDQVEPDANLDPQRQWLALCEEVGVRCVDLQPAFAAGAGAGSLFLDTQHPNAAGMRIAAREVARALRP